MSERITDERLALIATCGAAAWASESSEISRELQQARAELAKLQLCPIHEMFLSDGRSEPLTECPLCIRTERDELRKDRERLNWLLTMEVPRTEESNELCSWLDIPPGEASCFDSVTDDGAADPTLTADVAV